MTSWRSPRPRRAKNGLLRLDVERRYLCLVLCLFLAGRLLYWMLGVRFDASPLGLYIQYIDLELLRTRLLESVFYLREQPPLFNLFLGAVLKAFPHHRDAVFQAVYVAGGVAFSVILFSLLVRLRVSPRWTAVVTVIFTNSPTLLLHENWLFYTYPIAIGLCASALFLHRYLEARGTSDIIAFSFALATIVLTRGIFHLLWMLLVIAGLLWLEKGSRRQIAMAAALPCLLATAQVVKNYVVFHSLSPGPYFQQHNLWTMSIEALPDDVRQRLVEEGGIPPSDFAWHLPRPRETGAVPGRKGTRGLEDRGPERAHIT